MIAPSIECTSGCMTINLPDIWNAKSEPKPRHDVEKIFDNYITQVRQELEKLIAEKQPDKKPGNAASLVAELQLVLQDVGTQVAQAHKGTSAEHFRIADQLRNFAGALRSWCSVIVTSSGDAATNTRSRFADAGAWAMHYSTVRMTISTFFITTTWAVISLRWDDYSPELLQAALVVWLFAGAFLFVFTGLTHRAASRQQEYKSYLPALDGSSPPKGLKRSVVFWIWAPVGMYLIGSAGFGWLLCVWSGRPHKPPITWTAVVNESSIKKQEDEAGLQTVKLSDWGAKVDGIANSLDQIRLKLAEPMPTITPTPTIAPKGEIRRMRQARKHARSRSPASTATKDAR
jgi:hypothetical protein